MTERIKVAVWTIVAVIALVAVLYVTKFATKTPTGDVDFIKKTVTVTTTDAVQLEGDLYLPKSPKSKRIPGVVLLGPYLESRYIYTGLAMALTRQGIAALALDVRGSGAKSEKLKFAPEQVGKLPLDTQAAIAFLATTSGIDSTQMAILGTGVTARSALLAAGGNKSVRAVALVSALLDSAGFTAIRNAPFRPIMVVVSMQDAVAGSQARSIYDASKNSHSRIEVYLNAGEGSQIWWTQVRPEMEAMLARWLVEQLTTHAS